MQQFVAKLCSFIFTPQQLHPDTDDSLSEAEEEEVILLQKPLSKDLSFKISIFQGMYDDAEEDAGANGDGGGEESMDADQFNSNQKLPVLAQHQLVQLHTSGTIMILETTYNANSSLAFSAIQLGIYT